MPMNKEVAIALRRDFGYAPREDDGEKWVVFRDAALIVIHPERRPRVYRRGAYDDDDFWEIDPVLK